MRQEPKKEQNTHSNTQLDTDNCGDNCEWGGVMYAHGHQRCFPDLNTYECRNGGWIKVDNKC